WTAATLDRGEDRALGIDGERRELDAGRLQQLQADEGVFAAADGQQRTFAQAGRRGWRAGVVSHPQVEPAEAVEVVAGIELAEAILVEVDDEVALRSRQLQVGRGDDQGSRELEVADAEDE